MNPGPGDFINYSLKLKIARDIIQGDKSGLAEDNMEIYSNQIDEAIRIMREVAAWGRNRGFRIWPEDIIDYPNGRSMALYELEV